MAVGQNSMGGTGGAGFDVASVRHRFSSLGDSFAFFDAPGGSQVPDEVGKAIASTLRHASGNTGAPYATSRSIEALVAEAQAASARFLGCRPEEIVFGPNMTSLNFTLSRTLARALSPGDEVVVTRLDHDANVAPWLALAEDKGIVIRQVDIRPDTTLDLENLRTLLGSRTKVVAFPWASNAVGTVVDAARVCQMAHEAGALAWVDAVQYAPHQAIDVSAIGADVLICSSYKFCGPHLGIAYGRSEVLESFRPYKARPAPMSPLGHRFETGTMAYELLGGLVATFSYLEDVGGLAAIAAWEAKLGRAFLNGLPENAVLYGLPSTEGRVPTFLFNFPSVSSAQLSADLAQRGLGVWSADNYYALGLYERLGWGEALRVGLIHYNTIEEVRRLNQALGELTASTRHRAGSGAEPQAASAGRSGRG